MGGVEKTLVFDLASKVYVGADSSYLDPVTFQMCCDWLDVTLDISSLYSRRGEIEGSGNAIAVLENDKSVVYDRIGPTLAILLVGTKLVNSSDETRLWSNLQTLKEAVTKLLKLLIN